MNMTPKSMSSNESSGEGDNIVMKLSHNLQDKTHHGGAGAGNIFKFKLDEVPENCKWMEFINYPSSEEEYYSAQEARL